MHIALNNIFLFAALTLLAGCSSAPTYMGHRVHDISIPIAGGKTISASMTNAGPLPAENEDFKIEVAGFVVGPSKENPDQAVLTWKFGLTSKTGQSPEMIKVEEVSPSKEDRLLLEDTTPRLQGNIWAGSTFPSPAGKTQTPWLYEKKGSIYVFRFTIKSTEKPAVILYQPAWYSEAAKDKFRQHIDNINR